MPGTEPDDDGDEVDDGLDDLLADAGLADPPLPRQRKPLRSPRKRGAPRKKTQSVKSITKLAIAEGWAELGGRPRREPSRPRNRDECRGSSRPCPFVGCRHHTFLDVDPITGSITFNHPDLEPYELAHTCSLDVSAHGGRTLEEVGDIMNLTRERIRQIEIIAMIRLRRRTRVFGIDSPLG